MSAPAASTVSSTDLAEQLKSDTPPRILDVRTPAEFETAHIAGADNVPLDVVRERRAEVVDRLSKDPDASTVFVCKSGQRAAQAQELLLGEGLTHGSVLKGGIVDWESNGFEVDRGVERWDLERQVRLVAGSIVLTSVSAALPFPKLKWLAAGIGGRPYVRGCEQYLRDGYCAVQTAVQPHRA